jgi:hypothetical protein
VLSGEKLHAIPDSGLITMYRERSNLPLTELPQLGPVAELAYNLSNAADNYTAHSRLDVDFAADRAGRQNS